jgi:hypothetical protein
MKRDPKKLTGEPCPRCGRELISIGVVPFRVGGNPGFVIASSEAGASSASHASGSNRSAAISAATSTCGCRRSSRR